MTYEHVTQCHVCGRTLGYHEPYSIKPGGEPTCMDCDKDFHVEQLQERRKEEQYG